MKQKVKSPINDRDWYDRTVHKIAKYIITGDTQSKEPVPKPVYDRLRELMHVVVTDMSCLPDIVATGQVNRWAISSAMQMDKAITQQLSQMNAPSREIKRNAANTYNLQSRIIFVDVKRLGVDDIVPAELLKNVQDSPEQSRNSQVKEDDNGQQ